MQEESAIDDFDHLTLSSPEIHEELNEDRNDLNESLSKSEKDAGSNTIEKPPTNEAKSEKKKKSNKKSVSKIHQQRRPDKQLYVPPKAKNSPTIPVSDNMKDLVTSTASECKLSDTASHSQTHQSEPKTNCLHSENHSSKVSLPSTTSSLIRNSLDLNSSSEGENLMPKSDGEEEDCSWDLMFDDSGECVRPELLDDDDCEQNCDNATKKGAEKNRIDYNKFEPYEPEIENSEFAHVLEVYDFPSDLKTQDIVTAISVFK